MNRCRRRLRKHLCPDGRPKRRKDHRRAGVGMRKRVLTFDAMSQLRECVRDGWSLEEVHLVSQWCAHFYELRALCYVLLRMTGHHEDPTAHRVHLRRLAEERAAAERRWLEHTNRVMFASGS